MEQPILILCGDARLDALCALLREAGRPALRLNDTACEGTVRAAKTVVLPLPAVRDGCLSGDEAKTPWTRVFALFSPAQHIFGGGFNAEQAAFLNERTIPFFDFLRDEGFAQYNAKLTAQGALRLLLTQMEDDLSKQRVLITGFGRVGKAVATLLTAIGCRCLVAARSERQRNEAAASGCKAIALAKLADALPAADVVCNTVPAPLFSAELLQRCKKGGVFLELASAPFGASKEDCLAAGLRYPDGRGLPGRFTPLAAARAMLRAIDEAREVIPWTDPLSGMR